MLSNFKAALAARGIRQVDLALKIRISPTVLSEVINGRRVANADLRRKLSAELDVDEGWLFSVVSHVPRRRFRQKDEPTGREFVVAST